MAKATLQPIIDQVTRLPDVKQSVKTELARLADLVANAPTIEEAHEVANEIKTHLDELAAAVVANTPTP